MRNTPYVRGAFAGGRAGPAPWCVGPSAKHARRQNARTVRVRLGCEPWCTSPLHPRPSNHIWGIFYGDAYTPVKHGIFDRILRRSSGFEVNID